MSTEEWTWKPFCLLVHFSICQTKIITKLQCEKECLSPEFFFKSTVYYKKTLFGAPTLDSNGSLDGDAGKRKSEGVFWTTTISGQGYFGYCNVRL